MSFFSNNFHDFCLLVYNLTYDLKIRVNTRNENILIQLTSMILQLILLINAGLVLRDAWCIVTNSQEKEIYKEMKYIQSEIENCMNEKDGLRLFATRCDNPESKKIFTLLIQNLEQGGREIVKVLKLVVNDMWIQKKALVRRKVQSVSQKLLLLSAIVFIGILILIVVNKTFVNKDGNYYFLNLKGKTSSELPFKKVGEISAKGYVKVVVDDKGNSKYISTYIEKED